MGALLNLSSLTMAYAIDNCTPAEINAGVADQSSRIRLSIMEDVAMNDPYANLFEGGTLDSNVGEDVKTTIPGRVVLNQSMTAPATIRKINACGQQGPTAAYGSTDFTSRMEVIRGRGPDLCVHDAYHTVERSLAAMETGLRDIVREHMAADARYNLLVNSGHKLLWQTGTGNSLLTDMLTGGDRQVSVDFAALGYPNSRFPHKALVYLTKHILTTCQGVQRFGSGAGAYAVYIASPEAIEAMRDESGLKTETLAFVGGGDSEAKDALKRYSFADYPYRGIRTAEDLRPLRFNLVNGDNFPVLIEPYTPVEADHGTEWRINPDWLDAAYEVSFLCFKNSFKRNVPTRYVKDGSAEWPAQYVMGELEWTNFRSSGCNEYGDTGHFIYQIIRNWEPGAPWAVIPILSKRCAVDFGADACSTSSESSGD